MNGLEEQILKLIHRGIDVHFETTPIEGATSVRLHHIESRARLIEVYTEKQIENISLSTLVNILAERFLRYL